MTPTRDPWHDAWVSIDELRAAWDEMCPEEQDALIASGWHPGSLPANLPEPSPALGTLPPRCVDGIQVKAERGVARPSNLGVGALKAPRLASLILGADDAAKAVVRVIRSCVAHVLLWGRTTRW